MFQIKTLLCSQATNSNMTTPFLTDMLFSFWCVNFVCNAFGLLKDAMVKKLLVYLDRVVWIVAGDDTFMHIVRIYLIKDQRGTAFELVKLLRLARTSIDKERPRIVRHKKFTECSSKHNFQWLVSLVQLDFFYSFCYPLYTPAIF